MAKTNKQNMIARFEFTGSFELPANSEGVRLGKKARKLLHKFFARMQGTIRNNESGMYNCGTSRMVAVVDGEEVVLKNTEVENKQIEIKFNPRGESGLSKTDDFGTLLAASLISGNDSVEDEDEDEDDDAETENEDEDEDEDDEDDD